MIPLNGTFNPLPLIPCVLAPILMGPFSILGYFSSWGPLLVWGPGQVAPCPPPPLDGTGYKSDFYQNFTKGSLVRVELHIVKILSNHNGNRMYTVRSQER